MKIGLTGGIACGKSLLTSFLNEAGVETLDADAIVHELVPTEERRRLAKTVFANPAARRALEARLHPVVKRRIRDFLEAGSGLRVAVVPLLFEVQWEGIFDIIVCIASTRDRQIARMMQRRGYSREEAESRLAAQMPVEEKAAKSHYVIRNDGTAEELRAEAATLVSWLKEQKKNGR
jgi:dephospho-CoA kinase